MINLLPPEEKEELLLEQNKRLIAILGSALLIVLFCMFLISMSVKYYVLGEAVSQKFILEAAEKKYQTPDFIEAKSIIQKYNQNLAILKSFYKEDIDISQAVKDISNIQRPDGLYFTNLSLNRQKEEGVIDAAISGFSDTRENLLNFQKNIEENSSIKNPYFSPESWTRPKNINFSLTFKINRPPEK